MTININYKATCEDECNDILEIFFDGKDKNVTLEHLQGNQGVLYYGWTTEKQKMTFSPKCFEEILNFVE